MKPYRNRQTAYRLAVYAARFWSSSTKLGKAFPLAREGLAAAKDALGLTEAEVRGAIAALSKIGYLVPLVKTGTGFKPPVPGEARRRASFFHFGPVYGEAFEKANARAARARAKASATKSPVRTKEERKKVLTGEIRNQPFGSELVSTVRDPRLDAVMVAERLRCAETVTRTPEGQAFFERILARAG